MDWTTILSLIIYILIIIFLIVGIILGIKTIITINKTEKLIDSINEKMESLNPLFNILDFATDRLASLSDTVLDVFNGFIGKLFTKNKKRKDNEDE